MRLRGWSRGRVVIERLRPEVKPEEISDQEWKKSKCDQSPTGSHWFVPESATNLRCCFCGQCHTEVWDTGQWPNKGKLSGKSRGRSRLK